LDDVSGLIPRHIRSRDDLYAAEAINISKAVVKYLAVRPRPRSAPFTLKWVYRLHKEMFGDVWAWAGQRRKTDGLNIGCRPHMIDAELHNLLGDLAEWRDHGVYGAIERAARLHHRAVQIHPFLNGNGRWSRMLANIMLKQDGHSPIEWPEQTFGTASPIRDEYLAAVRAADGHDYSSLIDLHVRFAPPQ
jgi:Fic-DOC domain mobile mystery protein B